MLLEIGTQLDILLRNGMWVKNMTLLSAINSTITVKSAQNQQMTYDIHKDVAVIVKSSLIAV